MTGSERPLGPHPAVRLSLSNPAEATMDRTTRTIIAVGMFGLMIAAFAML